MPDEDRARRRSIRADDLEWQADQGIRSRLDGEKVEALDDDDAVAEEQAVRLRVADREVVESDEAYAPGEKVGGPVTGQAHEVARERVALPWRSYLAAQTPRDAMRYETGRAETEPRKLKEGGTSVAPLAPRLSGYGPSS